MDREREGQDIMLAPEDSSPSEGEKKLELEEVM